MKTNQSYYENIKENSIIDNHIIYGDNLEGLNNLIDNGYSGKIKCMCIDPPYNTKRNFTHYKDNKTTDQWLEFMEKRLILLKELLADDGSIWIFIDDKESHYLNILCDNIFMRKNYVASIAWQRKCSPINNSRLISNNHDYILVYGKNKKSLTFNFLPRTEEMNRGYKNPDNDPRGDYQLHRIIRTVYNDSKLFSEPYTFNNGITYTPPKNYAWTHSKEKIKELDDEDNRLVFNGENKDTPYKKYFLTDIRQGVVALSIWLGKDVGTNLDATKEVKTINTNDHFQTPKPEKLIHRILHLATNENDIVLDCFAGSGTSGAVAHKMKRRWIMMENGEHMNTHIIPRLKGIIDGTDDIGVTKLMNWQGGGGFSYYEC